MLPPNSKLLAQEIANSIIIHINTILGQRSTLKFMGAQPISFLQEHKQSLLDQDYYVCEKSDGVRYLLYIVMNDASGKPMQNCYFIDRKLQVYQLSSLYFPRNADQSLNETLVDGELVKSQDGYRFLTFDCVMCDGKVLHQRPLSSRLGHLKDLVLKPHHQYTLKQKQKPTIVIQLKHMFFAYDIPSVVEQIEKRLNHENDGLIFTAVDAPYTVGKTCEGMLKWKPSDQNSIDFKLRFAFDKDKHEPKWMLDILGDSTYQEFGQLYLDKEEDADLLKKFITEQADEKIVECKYVQGQWKFMRFREDKTTPNHISVVPRIMKSIEQGIKLEELMSQEFLDKVKENSKKRQMKRKGEDVEVPEKRQKNE